MESIDSSLAALAASQHGVVSREQAAALGMTRSAERHRVAAGRLERRSGRVLRVGGAPRTWHQDLMAAQLEAGDGAAVSHRAAAALHGLDTFGRGPVEITVGRNRRLLAPDAAVHRTRRLPAVDVVAIGPLAVTTVARTLLDLRSVASEERLLHAFDGALRDGLLSLPFLRWRFDDLARLGRPWSAAIRRLAAEEQPERRPTTVLERKMLDLVERAGLPGPLCQHRVREAGRVLARADFAWPERLVVVEVDGHGSHATRAQRRHDAHRADELRARGWQVLVFTYEQVVEEPAWVASVLARTLAIAA